MKTLNNNNYTNDNEKQWYIKDKAYFKSLYDSNLVGSAALDSKYYRNLADVGPFCMDSIGVARLIDKLFCFNDIYAYMFNRGYLTDERYVSNTSFNEEENSYSFTLNLTLLMQDNDIEQELYNHFKDKTHRKFSFILLHPNSNYRCPICGAYVVSSTYNTGNIVANNHMCNDCLALDSDSRKIKKQIRRELGVEKAINAELEKVRANKL